MAGQATGSVTLVFEVSQDVGKRERKILRLAQRGEGVGRQQAHTLQSGQKSKGHTGVQKKRRGRKTVGGAVKGRKSNVRRTEKNSKRSLTLDEGSSRGASVRRGTGGMVVEEDS